MLTSTVTSGSFTLTGLTLVGKWRANDPKSAAAACLYLLYHVVYNLYFHPFAKTPGPKLAALSGLPFLEAYVAGQAHLQALDLHRRYGDVVRIGPDELSFNTGQAWKDIYGLGRTKVLKKDRFAVSRPLKSGEYGVAAAVDANHARQRRLMSYAFSEKALFQHEQIMRKHLASVHKYISDTLEDGNKVIDAGLMYKLFAFDLISDLAFGESFNCLLDPASRPLEQVADQAVIQILFLNMLRRLWAFRTFFPYLQPKSAMANPLQFAKAAEEKLSRRLALQDKRSDLIGHIMEHATEDVPMSPGELRANAKTFLTAGSTTTASFLGSTTYFLAENQHVQDRLRQELKANFASPDDITIVSTKRLPYLQAVVSEGLRIHPPIPGGLIREAFEPTFVCGIAIPKKALVSASIFASNLDEKNFYRPFEFCPERWLDPKPTEFADDKSDSMNSFSMGPRGCIGKNLAMAEIRMMLSHLLWEYRILPVDTESSGTPRWIPQDQKAWMVWAREPNNVRMDRITSQ